jgi:hypothetical protein
MMYVHVTTALAAASLLTLVSYAQAQSIPSEGELHVTYTTTAVPASKAMEIGDGKQYMQVNLIMTASNDQGDPILNKMAGRCQLTRLIEGKTVETHGYCTYTDADNNQIFEKCDFLPGQPNNCKLTGGTGKFGGLQASIVITTQPVKSSFDDVFQSWGHKDGTYKIAPETSH